MTQESEHVDKLVAMIRALQEETNDFLEHPEDAQLWYNRGYANGVIEAMRALGYAQALQNLSVDDSDLIKGHELMAWGKAYQHGIEKGSEDTHDVLSMRG